MTDSDILGVLRDELAAVLPDDHVPPVDVTAITAETPLLSLPLDSLALAELVERIEERLRVFIPEDKAFAFKTVGQVVTFIRDGLAAKAERRAARGGR